MESFQSLYLKAYYPLEFQVAVINNFGGFYRTWVYFNEVRRQGGNIHLPCINRSDYKTNIKGKDIFTGFIHLSGLEQKTAAKLLDERERNSPFQSLEDFVRRVSPAIEQLVLLVRAGAFGFIGKPKPALLWEAYSLQKTEAKRPKGQRLFKEDTKPYSMPPLECKVQEDAYDEIELLGFPVSMSYFDMLKTSFRSKVKARNMIHYTGKTVRMLELLVTIKYVRTVKKEIMHFATFLDDEGEMFDTTHFPDTLRSYPFSGDGIYLILGKIVDNFGYASVEVRKMAKLPFQQDPRTKQMNSL